MTKSPRWQHTPESRAKIGASNRARWDDPAKRAAVSEATKARMADPAVRQRIRDGMREAAAQADELFALKAAWSATRPAARVRFIVDLLAPATASDNG